jgi:transposase-like protein
MEHARKPKKIYSPEQKLNILQTVENEIKAGFLNVTQALEKHGISYSNYHKWKKQLAVGVKSSLRNGKAPADKEKREMERRIARLEKLVLSQAQTIADLKKETNWD